MLLIFAPVIILIRGLFDSCNWIDLSLFQDVC